MPALIEPDTPDTVSQLEIEPLAHRFSDAYWRAMRAEAEGRINGLRHAMRNKYQLLNASPAHLEWRDLSYAEQLEPGSGFEVYAHIKQFARDDLESGERAADVVASSIMRPWVRARYLVLRESFIADWKPTGSIETRLIEMMAQLYTAYEHWMELSVQRVAIECQEETYQIRERGGKWRSVSITGDADAQQAAEMADRYNRLFLRTLRQLRDLRRYVVPVTINNPQQVNIAADGGQQVNVQKSKQTKKQAKKAPDTTSRGRRKPATKPNPKQLARKMPEESISMKPAKDKQQDALAAPGSRRLRVAKRRK
jgi:hypothetical protein